MPDATTGIESGAQLELVFEIADEAAQERAARLHQALRLFEIENERCCHLRQQTSRSHLVQALLRNGKEISVHVGLSFDRRKHAPRL